ncbi:MAG: hypothetical protein K2Z25_10150, partial [Beijerinckiaceae bacterium]|nr:hypothetical protein [Beijerinckiaceae bacterium]
MQLALSHSILAAGLALMVAGPGSPVATPALAQQGKTVVAQAAPVAPAQGGRGRGQNSPLGGLGGDSKEPIKIDADKLDVLDKENKAVFTGKVVAVQGETTVRCSVMTVFYEGRSGGPGGAGPLAVSLPGRGQAPAAGWSSRCAAPLAPAPR